MGKLLEAKRRNPFAVLGASPRDSREQLNEKAAVQVLFGETGSEQALAKLLLPAGRLEAELDWFPNTEPEMIEMLLAACGDGKLEGMRDRFESGSMLSAFHALCLYAEIMPMHTLRQMKGWILSISIAADALLPSQVMEEINQDRRAAGIQCLTDEAQMTARIHELLRREAVLATERIRQETVPQMMRGFVSSLEALIRSPASHYYASLFIELVIQELRAQEYAL